MKDEMVGAHTGWPWVEELISVRNKWEHIYFGVGTNGLPWKESLAQVEQLGLGEDAKRKLLRDNAVQLFKL